MTSPDVEVRVLVLDDSGSVVRRLRLRWRCAPVAADLLGGVADRALRARRDGQSLRVDTASEQAWTVLHLAGCV